MRPQDMVPEVITRSAASNACEKGQQSQQLITHGAAIGACEKG